MDVILHKTGDQEPRSRVSGNSTSGGSRCVGSAGMMVGNVGREEVGECGEAVSQKERMLLEECCQQCWRNGRVQRMLSLRMI